MTPPSSDDRERLDRALKALMRHVYPAFFRLAGIPVDPSSIRIEDTAINVREHHADHVFPVGEDDDPARCAYYLEYQLEPDIRDLPTWFFKTGALTRQLRREVLLIVVYLTRGDRTTFPESYEVVRPGVRNTFTFHTIRLWEFREQIQDGLYPELAPLLVLCEDTPGEETLLRERELILGLEVTPEERGELLGAAAMIGLRFFARGVVSAVFREERGMLNYTENVKEFVRDLFAEELAEGRAEGVRAMVLAQLGQRFGELPAEVVAQIESLDAERCLDLGKRILDARSLEDLGLLEPPGP